MILQARTARNLDDKLKMLRHTLQMLKITELTNNKIRDEDILDELPEDFKKKKRPDLESRNSKLSVPEPNPHRVIKNFKYSSAVEGALKAIYGIDPPTPKKGRLRRKDTSTPQDNMPKVMIFHFQFIKKQKLNYISYSLDLPDLYDEYKSLFCDVDD